MDLTLIVLAALITFAIIVLLIILNLKQEPVVHSAPACNHVDEIKRYQDEMMRLQRELRELRQQPPPQPKEEPKQEPKQQSSFEEFKTYRSYEEVIQSRKKPPVPSVLFQIFKTPMTAPEARAYIQKAHNTKGTNPALWQHKKDQHQFNRELTKYKKQYTPSVIT